MFEEPTEPPVEPPRPPRNGQPDGRLETRRGYGDPTNAWTWPHIYVWWPAERVWTMARLRAWHRYWWGWTAEISTASGHPHTVPGWRVVNASDGTERTLY